MPSARDIDGGCNSSTLLEAALPDTSGTERQRSPSDELQDAEAIANALQRLNGLGAVMELACCDPVTPHDVGELLELVANLRETAGLVAELAEAALDAAIELVLAARIRAEQAS